MQSLHFGLLIGRGDRHDRMSVYRLAIGHQFIGVLLNFANSTKLHQTFILFFVPHIRIK